MSLTDKSKKNMTNGKMRKGIFLIIRQDIMGTAEDDLILGYKRTEKEARRFAEEMEYSNEDYHYYIREVFELEDE